MTLTELHTTDELKELISNNKTVIVSCWVNWSQPCRLINPVFEKYSSDYSEEGNLAFATVDIEENEVLASTLKISALPTFYVYHDSEPADSLIGGSRQDLDTLIKRAIDTVH